MLLYPDFLSPVNTKTNIPLPKYYPLRFALTHPNTCIVPLSFAQFDHISGNTVVVCHAGTLWADVKHHLARRSSLARTARASIIPVQFRFGVKVRLNVRFLTKCLLLWGQIPVQFRFRV